MPPQSARLLDGTDGLKDDTAAFDTAITNIYDAKGKLNQAQYRAQGEVITENIRNLNEANRITSDIATRDQASLRIQGAERQEVYGHDIETTRAQGERTGQAYDLNIGGLESQRDFDLAGYDLALEQLGGQRGLTQERFRKGAADIQGAQRSAELNAYTAALSQMYGSGSAAGIAVQGDQSLREAAGITQSRLGRDLNLLSKEAQQADTDFGHQIAKTQLGRSASEASFGNRIAQAEHAQETEKQKTESSIKRQGFIKEADAQDTKARIERSELALELENEQHQNSLALQNIAQRLATESQGHQATIFINEMRTLQAQNHMTTLQITGGLS